MSEPVGVMKCWECVEKHSRDLEHHFEDLVRVTKEPNERLKYEDWIDRVREIRREAHKNAKDISTTEELPYHEKKRLGLSSKDEEEVTFSEGNPIRVEKGEKVWSEIFHEREECDPKGFRTIKPNPEHILTICCPKGQYSEEAGRCLIGTMAHKLEHLHPEKRGGCSVCEALA